MAAEKEETVEKHPVTPGPLIPARELFGDLLAEHGDPSGALAAYEATLERSFYKALHELQSLQAARDGQAVPVPTVVDVTVSGAEEMALVGEIESAKE